MSRLQASLVGGLFIGIVSSLPLVNMLNLCCCLWVVMGGGLTTYMLQSGQTRAIETADAAMTGLLAGVIGALVGGLLSLVMFLMVGDMSERIRSMADQLPQLPPEVRDQIASFDGGAGYVILSSVISLPIYAVFSMAGALLALLIFRKPTAPAAQA